MSADTRQRCDGCGQPCAPDQLFGHGLSDLCGQCVSDALDEPVAELDFDTTINLSLTDRAGRL